MTKYFIYEQKKQICFSIIVQEPLKQLNQLLKQRDAFFSAII